MFGPLLLLAAGRHVGANMFDTVEPGRAPPSSCKHGCANWADLASDGNTRSQADVDAKWTTGKPPADAGRTCAAPGLDPGTDGAWCYCRDSQDSSYGYCEPVSGIPEQVNVQIATRDTVVVSFVTFESSVPARPPTVSFEGRELQGVTHAHRTPAGDRVVYMHFVKLSGLAPGKLYNYTVRSGGAGAASSPTLRLRSPTPAGDAATKIAIFGDMGVYAWNNMGNLLADCQAGDVHAVVHAGDHAYNEGQDDERRADGYMNMYSRIVSECPWVPIVGNHEYYDDEMLKRYEDSTWENWNDTAHMNASSSLGGLLSRGTFLGAGVLGPVRSGTSRWFSVDIGLVHLIALDLNVYFGVDDPNATLKQEQAAWLRRDLEEANRNRATAPWVVASSHYPFYCSECGSMDMTADWYANGFTFDGEGVEHEHPPMNASQLKRMRSAMNSCMKNSASCDERWARAVGSAQDDAIKDLMPIIHAGGVDMYITGHWHFYESFWPMGVPAHGGGAAATQTSMENPKSTVHLTTGNGGPPSKDSYPTKQPAMRAQSLKYGYGRLTVPNATHILYEQVLNGWAGEGKAGEVIDSFHLVQGSHGPFPPIEEEALMV